MFRYIGFHQAAYYNSSYNTTNDTTTTTTNYNTTNDYYEYEASSLWRTACSNYNTYKHI